jgi:adenosylcobinamide amidohydrolase
MTIDCHGPWMIVHLAHPHRCLSWAPVLPGFAVASKVAWLFLEIDELADVADPPTWLAARLHAAGHSGVIGLMTSRRRHQHSVAEARHDDGLCRCVATVSLGNALTAGDPAGPGTGTSRTINLLCQLSEPLTDGAMAEAVALAAEARTSALLASGVRSTVSGQPATGTGTDCIVIAAALGGTVAYCGKHTRTGERLGRAVHQAVSAGIAQWQQEFA